MEIGAKIRSIRLRRGLTQGELAARCELTKGYISQLEHDLSSPSIATLIDILNVLGVTPQTFFTEEKDGEKIVFTKSDYFESNSGECSNIWLIPNSQKNDMEPIILEIPVGCKSETREPFEGQEFGYVLQGRVKIVANGKVHRAKNGDSFYIDGAKEHYIENMGDCIARIIWVTTPSNF